MGGMLNLHLIGQMKGKGFAPILEHQIKPKLRAYGSPKIRGRFPWVDENIIERKILLDQAVIVIQDYTDYILRNGLPIGTGDALHRGLAGQHGVLIVAPVQKKHIAPGVCFKHGNGISILKYIPC